MHEGDKGGTSSAAHMEYLGCQWDVQNLFGGCGNEKSRPLVSLLLKTES